MPNATSSRVYGILLSSILATQGQQLAGILPSALGNLTQLRYLVIPGQGLTVCLPGWTIYNICGSSRSCSTASHRPVHPLTLNPTRQSAMCGCVDKHKGLISHPLNAQSPFMKTSTAEVSSVSLQIFCGCDASSVMRRPCAQGPIPDSFQQLQQLRLLGLENNLMCALRACRLQSCLHLPPSNPVVR